MSKWHMMSIDSVLKELKTNEKGLKEKDVQKRLEEQGLNKLKSEKKKTALLILLDQFKSFLVLLLLAAVFISIFMGVYFDEGHFVDAIVIGAILVLNAILGFYQEYKAEKTLEALKKMIVTNVVVIRDGEHHEINAEGLVPGDIVLLEAGKRVPADLRLLEVKDLKIDESALTGESVSVKKNIKALRDVTVSERKNMAFMGTLVTYGRAKGVVVSTGMLTEMGKIAGMVQEKEEQTPLQIKLQDFGKKLGIAVVIITLLIFILGLFREDLDPFNMFMVAMSLAISAVPEGLPAVITLTLAVGSQRMMKRKSVIKRLGAVEALGGTTVICADKTGTMTSNEMTVRKVWVAGKLLDITGVGFEPKGDFLLNNKKLDPKKEGSLETLLKISLMCNDSIVKEKPRWRIIGDPTEGALKVLAMKGGVTERYNRIDEIPFSSERKKMTTIHMVDKEIIAYSKGAPEIVLDMCDKIYVNKKLTPKDKEKIVDTVHELASKGLRVLAFSYRNLDSKYSLKSVEDKMTFIGLAAMIDPPREETKNAIELCKKAGIKIIMITGDHEITAKAIGVEVGLYGKSMRGEELDKIGDKELQNIVEEITIFARISPQHKLKIVEALKAKGHIVAVSGDGVNDAPALKRADVGIAMGIKGTDVSKEAADIVLLDDNFSTIVAAVEEGRGIYDNINKFVRFLLAANFDELATVTVPILIGLTDPATGLIALPYLVIHILWINLITDGVPALALGLDPKDPNIMNEPPRDSKKGIISGLLFFIIAVSILNFLASFVIFVLELQSTGDITKARTLAVTTTILFEMFFVFNCRSEKKGVFRLNPLENKKLFVAVVISILLQITIIYVPFFQEIFHFTALNLMDWVKVLLFASLGLLAMPELLIKKRKNLKRIRHL